MVSAIQFFLNSNENDHDEKADEVCLFFLFGHVSFTPVDFFILSIL